MKGQNVTDSTIQAIAKPAMISIVIPAHNESSVISRALSTLVSGAAPEETSVVVVCNGCTDDTPSIARRFAPEVRVIETEVANKTHALNLGDRASHIFPRVYADADIVITVDAVRTLARRLERGDVLAVAPTPDVNLTGCSWPVRKYFDVRSRLPSSREGIGGSGVYALSEAGRRRFVEFPNVISDDTYVRLQFKRNERETLGSVKSIVFAPRTVARLIAVRTRAYVGMSELAARFPELWTNRGEANHRTLVGLLKEPRLWFGWVVYCYVHIFARCRAAILFKTGTVSWQRDDTSRAALPQQQSMALSRFDLISKLGRCAKKI
jgi:glycosyltransferase involved in cell wall biosynthesis